MSIFDLYRDLTDAGYVETYPLQNCPTARDPEGPILDLDVAVALLRFEGNLGKIAQTLHRSRRVIETYIQRNDKLQELQEDIYEAFVDDAEEKARTLARGGDGGMIKFMLSTIGKRRGYVTRVENTGKDGAPLAVQFYLPTNGRETPGMETDGRHQLEAGRSASGSAGQGGDGVRSHRELAADVDRPETSGWGMAPELDARTAENS